MRFRTGARTLPFFRITTWFTPSVPTRLPFVPRDLYPIDRHDDPLGTAGCIYAAQRGLNAGLLYFRARWGRDVYRAAELRTGETPQAARPHVSTIDGDVLRPHERTADRIDYLVPANGRLVLRWEG